MAQLWSSLEARESETQALLQTVILGEQAAALGFIMQHFQHRLRSDLGAFSGLYERMLLALRGKAAPAMTELMVEFRSQIEQAGRSFAKSVGYIKVPERRQFGLRKSIDQVLFALVKRINRLKLQVDINVEQSAQCEWDENIFQLTLSTLIENALDEFERVRSVAPALQIEARATDAGISVFVSDNGPGVLPAISAKIFTFGVTFKPNGLGSALAFGRQRMQIMGGDLMQTDSRVKNWSGACFEIKMPTAAGGGSINSSE